MIAKALTLPADGLILDLEDAVAPDLKAQTRPIVRRWLTELDFGPRERWVRMNPIATGLGVKDLEETIAGRPEGYVVPKPRHAGDVREIAQILDGLEHRHQIRARLDPPGADRHRDAGGPAEHPRGGGGQPPDRHRVVGDRGPGRGHGPAARARRREPLSGHPALRARHVHDRGLGRRRAGARHRLHRHRRSGRAPARVRGRRGDGLHRQDLHPSLADRGDQRGVHAAAGGRRRGAGAGGRLRGAPPGAASSRSASRARWWTRPTSRAR